jgi:transposase-like protein
MQLNECSAAAMKPDPAKANCPYCLSTEGFVRGLTVKANDQRTLKYICEDCRRSWEKDHSPAPTAVPVTGNVLLD